LLLNQRRIDELASIAELALSGRVKVHIHTILPLSDARKAQELSQSGHVIGKLVLRVAPDDPSR
jgi:NADPH:quinone reductase-like Zn-dependent oxidoreductase